jgi:hypothetical protein
MTEKRPHRTRQPFRDFQLGPKERAAQSRVAPVRALVAVLGHDEAFLELIEAVRKGNVSAGEGARRYVRRDGRPRRVIRHVIERAATSRSTHPQLRVYGVALTTVWTSAPLGPGDPTEWTHAKRLPDAAAMVAALGAGECIVPGCRTRLRRESSRRRYCSSHESEAGLRGRADREAVLALLNGVGDALVVS